MKILALDVGGTAVKSAIINDGGQLCDIRSTPSGTIEDKALAEISIAVAKEYGGFDVLAISMTGQIDSNTQTTLASFNGKELERACYPVGKVIKEAIDRPVFILNDANAAALGEAKFGAGKNRSDFVCITYGTGVGGGIIQNGRLLTGSRGVAGEIGHLVTHVDGRECNCGRRGCYQQYAATTALVREAQKVCADIQNAKQIFERLPKLQGAVDGWIKEIVEGLCSLAYIFDTECFVLGGGVMERDDVLQTVREQFKKRIMPSFSDIEIVKAELGNTAGMIGAAVYAKEQIIERGNIL